MKSIITLVLLTLTMTTTGYGQFGKLLDKAKESAGTLKDMATGDKDALDISGGLKEALNKGVGEAVTKLSATDGFMKSQYKVLIPQDAAKVIKTLKRVPGFGDVEDKLIAKMNAAAEVATKNATPIFVDAIKQMTIGDAKSILFGEDDAATKYLETSSRKKLYKAFLPVIVSALDEVDATKYWNSVVKKYNSLPLTKDINPDLDDHVNNKALDGLFGLVKVKESGIRKDIDQRTSPLLKDVFGKLDK